MFFYLFLYIKIPITSPIIRGRNMASKIINFYDTVLQTKPERLVCFLSVLDLLQRFGIKIKDLCDG